MCPDVLLARSTGMLRLSLARPERQNSIGGRTLRELNAGLDEAERMPDCRLVVLEGQGGSFCTGMDFEDAAESQAFEPAQASRGASEFLTLLKRLTTIPRVVVAAVDGRVSGGGVGLAAASDLVFATERSTFALPEALWGLLPCSVLPFLVRRTGFQPAYALTLSTRPVTARQALHCHLADEVAGDVEPLLERLLFRLRRIQPATVADLKRYFQHLWSLSPGMEAVAVEEFTRLMSSEVVRRTITAFTDGQKLPWEP